MAKKNYKSHFVAIKRLLSGYQALLLSGSGSREVVYTCASITKHRCKNWEADSRSQDKMWFMYLGINHISTNCSAGFKNLGFSKSTAQWVFIGFIAVYFGCLGGGKHCEMLTDKH